MKKILVTGSNGGMGSAICERLLRNGYQVFGLDYRKSEKRGKGKAMQFIPCDVTDPLSVEKAFYKIKERAGRLDAIVHTAGIYDLDSLLEMGEERFLGMFEVNLFGVYRINKAFVPLMRSGSRIIITTSELAPLDPLPFTGVYAITKAALEKYAFSLRMEVQLLGISVSVIRPGAVKTGLLGDSTRALDRFCSNTRLYRCNAKRFQGIVDRVETRSIAPDQIAETVCKALKARHPEYVYNINRNIFLRLLNTLPDAMQTAIIRRILTP